MAYALNYLVYWITMAFLVKQEISKMGRHDVNA